MPKKRNTEHGKAHEVALTRIADLVQKMKESLQVFGGYSLDLSDLGLVNIPSEIGQLTTLKALDLSRNQLTKLSPEIGQLTTLTVLKLSHNQLTGLPPEIGRLTGLTDLFLRSNQLTELPPEIGQLTGINALDLTNNRLISLPPEIGQLTALQNLYLDNNRLAELPPEIGQLTELKELHVVDNQLTELPEEIGQLTKLTALYLYNNRVTELPKKFGGLTKLTALYLYNNQLTELPPGIGRLSALATLSLYDNKLSLLPAEIGGLRSLTSLYLDNNWLIELPLEICDLVNLTSLDLSNNKLVTLPKDIHRLTALNGLFLHGNPYLGIPEDALGPTYGEIIKTDATPKSPRQILSYYFSIRDVDSIALREIKLIVVGWGKAGKTTLIKRLAREPMDASEPETHGILIRPLTLTCSDGDLATRVWDFGGQHVLHAMHEFFLTARSLYLLVLEQRSDRAETDAKYWLQLIRSYAPFAPVVVALNKSRGVERPLDRESLEATYGPIVAWVPTECSAEVECSGAEQTILNLRTALTAASEKQWLPEPRKRFPGKWAEIKKWLESLDRLKKNYLDYETFTRECADRGESDSAKQAEVAALMHDLGIAMNYARDERLRDTTVLRPDWLANGIYAVLRANLFLPGKLLVPDAVLTPEKLGEIYSVAGQKPVEMLNSSDYPVEKWEFLLRLMNVFQLCFPLSVDGRRQLCPTLLRAELPPQTDEPQGEDRVQLRYEFPVVPAPLLPRFIVRTFSLVEQGKLWQRGAMLRYVEAVARVWTTAEEKYLFATVAGSEEDRADLLAIIRGTLTELFREYRDLAVTEQHWFDGQWVPRATLEKFGVLKPEKGTAADRPEVIL